MYCRSLKDRQHLISQHNCDNKLYDHDIFIEPALARSLHLRDIQSMPRDTETRQSEVEFVQGKKTSIYYKSSKLK